MQNSGHMVSYSVAISVFCLGGLEEGKAEILDANMTFVRPKGRKHRSPHELCGKICYCSWPPNSFRHFQDQFLTTNRGKWGKITGLCFSRFVFLTFRGPLASHDSDPYPNRSHIARYNATKVLRVWNGAFQTMLFRFLALACDRGKPFQRDKDCLQTPVFLSIFGALADPDRPLNTPLWKTPFRKHCLIPLG